jgi:putative ABC transport system ATP-binding protein
MEMMSELAHQRGRAVVIVTHDSRVLSFADRTVRIEDGQIVGGNPEPLPAPELVAHAFPQSSLNLAGMAPNPLEIRL